MGAEAPELPVCFERVPWLAVEVVIGAGRPASHCLAVASRAASRCVAQALPHAQRLLPCPCYATLSVSSVARLDLASGVWEAVRGREAVATQHGFFARDGVLFAATLRATPQRLAVPSFEWEGMDADCPGAEQNRCMVAGPDGALYIIDEDPSGDARIQWIPADRHSAEVLWRGKALPCGGASLGAKGLDKLSCMVAGGYLYWIGLANHRRSTTAAADCALIGFALEIQTANLFCVPELRDQRIQNQHCDYRKVVAVAGRVYLVAHCDHDTKRRKETAVLAWRLDLAAGWEPLPPALTTRTAFAVAALGGLLYLIGGEGAHGEVLDTVERFDPFKGAWEAAPRLPTPRSVPTALALGGRLFVLGGSGGCYERDIDAPWPDKIVESFDSLLGRWSQLPSIPSALLRDGFLDVVDASLAV